MSSRSLRMNNRACSRWHRGRAGCPAGLCGTGTRHQLRRRHCDRCVLASGRLLPTQLGPRIRPAARVRGPLRRQWGSLARCCCLNSGPLLRQARRSRARSPRTAPGSRRWSSPPAPCPPRLGSASRSETTHCDQQQAGPATRLHRGHAVGQTSRSSCPRTQRAPRSLCGQRRQLGKDPAHGLCKLTRSEQARCRQDRSTSGSCASAEPTIHLLRPSRAEAPLQRRHAPLSHHGPVPGRAQTRGRAPRRWRQEARPLPPRAALLAASAGRSASGRHTSRWPYSCTTRGRIPTPPHGCCRSP
mmetsp:Transcript_4173/g.10736  ORF Transcript_4173/g.10736 Transcript_4173/m.10736 type:complete len:300 (+) Transcript_4173:144-1043(+)